MELLLIYAIVALLGGLIGAMILDGDHAFLRGAGGIFVVILFVYWFM